VVDDDPAIRDLLVDILGDANFATTCFGFGQPALTAVLQHHFDVLLIDQWLPDINGLELCEAAHHHYGATAVILMITADPRVDRHITALTVGADDVVQKPFHVDILLARIAAKLRSTTRVAV
jgi:DNA-binding response OmpR family regulator